MFNKEKPPSTVDTKTCTVNTTRGRVTKVVELPPSDGSDSPLNYIFSIRATVQQAGIVFNSMHILGFVLLRRFKRRRLPVDNKKKKKIRESKKSTSWSGGGMRGRREPEK